MRERSPAYGNADESIDDGWERGDDDKKPSGKKRKEKNPGSAKAKKPHRSKKEKPKDLHPDSDPESFDESKDDKPKPKPHLMEAFLEDIFHQKARIKTVQKHGTTASAKAMVLSMRCMLSHLWSGRVREIGQFRRVRKYNATSGHFHDSQMVLKVDHCREDYDTENYLPQLLKADKVGHENQKFSLNKEAALMMQEMFGLKRH